MIEHLGKLCATSPIMSASFAIPLLYSSCDDIPGGNALQTFESAGLADNFRTTLTGAPFIEVCFKG